MLATRLSPLVLAAIAFTIAILAGWALFGEVPAVLALLGGALCLVGVGLSRRREPSVRVVSGTALADVSE